MSQSKSARSVRIGDAGERLGGARKDLYAGLKSAEGAPAAVDDPSEPDAPRNLLKQRWPRPDFRQDALHGVRPAQHAALFLVIYDNLARRPPAPTWLRIPEKFWLDAYERGVDFFRRAYESGSYSDWRSLSAAYEAMLSATYTAADERKLAPYACGKASTRRLFSPFRFLPEARMRYQFLVALGWPQDAQVRDDDAFGAVQVKEARTGRTSWRACKGEGSLYHFLDDRTYPDRSSAARAAVAAFRAIASKRNPAEPAKGKSKTTPPRRPLLDRPAERVGPDRRGTTNITLDGFRELFGFRGVEFGNWVSQSERQGYLDATHDALMDLIELLGAEPAFASFGGCLGIAFGSRGRGLLGGAAHFERDNWIVHLTKSQGSGALAHEYGHAIDALLLVAGGPTDLLVPPIYASAAARNAVGARRPVRLGPGVGGSAPGALRTLGEAWWGGTAHSQFLANALDLDSGRAEGYWSKPTELFARGFETWVTDRLHAQGRKNEFLAFGAEEGDGSTWGARCSPYASGAERRRLNEHYSSLFVQGWLRHVTWRPGTAAVAVSSLAPISGETPASAPTMTCPACGRLMRRRTGARGAFWGCSGYGVAANPCSKTVNDIAGIPAGYAVVNNQFVPCAPGN